MPTCQTSWEDDDNNRRVAMQVDYDLDAGQARVAGVTPTRVSFLDEARQITREIGVWTERGRRLLAREAEANGWTRRLVAKIEAGQVHDIRHDEPSAMAAAESAAAIKA
ncbi:MAG: hypothetical protein AAGB00_07030 [Planctomycetota bacterium]